MILVMIKIKLKNNLNSEYIKNQLLKDRELAEKLIFKGYASFYSQ